MNTKKFQLLLALMLTIAISASAQNPYAEIDNSKYADVLKFTGQKPTITDFVTYYIGEPDPPEEDDGLECGWICDFRDIWYKYRKNKPLTTSEKWTEKVTVDAKNGYACLEAYFALKEDNYKRDAKIEICYWNCSDGKHKVVAVSETCTDNGKASGPAELFGGFQLYLYNNTTHKITRADLGVDVKTGYEHIGQDQKDGEYFRIDHNTGERKKITKKEYDDWSWAFVTYALPRVGKDIVATIHDLPNGEKDKTVVVKWNGVKFEVQK